MTSIIKVDTIQNKAGSTTLDADKLPDMYTSSPKAFSSTNAAGTTINESFNISSLGDTATGRQLLSFTNNMNGSTYMSNANANSSQNDWGHAGSVTKSTSQCDTTGYDAGGSYQDNDMSTIIMGALA